MKKVALVLGVAVALTGCMQVAEITSEPAKALVVSSFPKERLAKRTTQITIRAFQPGEKENTRGPEVIGAKCTLVSDELRAEVVTPQKVIVPSFK